MAVVAISIDCAIHYVDLYKDEDNLNSEIYMNMIYFKIILHWFSDL